MERYPGEELSLSQRFRYLGSRVLQDLAISAALFGAPVAPELVQDRQAIYEAKQAIPVIEAFLHDQEQ